MPSAAPRPCTYVGCGVLTATGRCEAHRHLHTGRFGDKHRGSRHQRGYGTAWDHQRLRILKRDSGLCQICLKLGRIEAANQVDHIVPKAEDGSDDDDNLQAVSAACHREKSLAEALRARGLTPGPARRRG